MASEATFTGTIDWIGSAISGMTLPGVKGFQLIDPFFFPDGTKAGDRVTITVKVEDSDGASEN